MRCLKCGYMEGHAEGCEPSATESTSVAWDIPVEAPAEPKKPQRKKPGTPRKRILATVDSKRFWIELHPSGAVSVRQHKRRVQSSHNVSAQQLVDFVLGQARLKL